MFLFYEQCYSLTTTPPSDVSAPELTKTKLHAWLISRQAKTKSKTKEKKKILASPSASYSNVLGHTCIPKKINITETKWHITSGHASACTHSTAPLLQISGPQAPRWHHRCHSLPNVSGIPGSSGGLCAKGCRPPRTRLHLALGTLAQPVPWLHQSVGKEGTRGILGVS